YSLFFLYLYVVHRDLHSFPTRRSSDLIVLIFAYTTRYFAASVGSVENGFSKIPSSIDDVSRIFCENEAKSIFKIYLPILKPYLLDRKSTRLNSSHVKISYAVFCLKKKN